MAGIASFTLYRAFSGSIKSISFITATQKSGHLAGRHGSERHVRMSSSWSFPTRPAGVRRDVMTTARWVGGGRPHALGRRRVLWVSIEAARANWRCYDVNGSNDCDVCWRLLSRRARVYLRGSQAATCREVYDATHTGSKSRWHMHAPQSKKQPSLTKLVKSMGYEVPTMPTQHWHNYC